MKNRFYKAFDCERLHSGKQNQTEIRSPFQIDRDRIVFSYAFRRLQSKTQVFQSGEFDFYRNRLTHSIEVAKIARSITDFLNHHSNELQDDYCIDVDLVEAVGMAHDLGHPPFGHIGERKLNQLMAGHGGFEGNAQTLRILTHLFYSRTDGSTGMNPSRALIDGILKYKELFSDRVSESEDGEKNYPDNHFLYDQDKDCLSFALGNRLPEILEYCSEAGISINRYKSLECQIMDWADDTAYSINDIIDSIQAGYLTPIKIENWAAGKPITETEQAYLDELVGVISKSRHEAFLNKQIGTFIHAVRLQERQNPLSEITNRYKYGIVIDEETKNKAKLYKRLAVDLIFRSTQIHRIEYKGAMILEKLFVALKENYLSKESNGYLNLIPERFSSQLSKAPTTDASMRILCDTISEMTDALAIRTHKQLFDPDFGSILDII